MTQRLGLARTCCCTNPRFCSWTTGLRAWTRAPESKCAALLKELRNMGKTIMVSSHILPELADICNKIGIIERGKLLFNGDVETAIAQVRQKRVFLLSVRDERNPFAAKTLETDGDIEKVELLDHDKTIKATIREGLDDGSFLPERLIQAGYKIRMFKEEEVNLEDVFMQITKGITN